MGPSVVHSFLQVFHHFTHEYTQWDRVWCIHFFKYFTIFPWSHSIGPSVVHSFPHYFTTLPMITLNGTECGAFISSLFHHFTHDHTQWDRVWCIHFLIISPFYPWSHSMGPSVVHSFPHYFTILPMITLNGTECGAFISSLFHHFTHDHTQWDPVWCIHFLIISPFYSWSHSLGPSVVHSYLHYFTILPMITLNGTECGAFIFSLFHHFTHNHTQWDRVLCIHFLIISPFCPWSHSMGPSVVHSFPHYFTILPMITLNATECGAFISSLFHHFAHDHTQWDRVWCIHFLIISPFYQWSHSMGSSVVHSFPHYLTILSMLTINGTECGALISSLFHHFTHDHTQWDPVWCIFFLIISPFCPWSHSMGPSVVHSFLHYFTILPMITLNGTECGAFISSLFHHFIHDQTQWDPVWCIHFFKYFTILPMITLNGTECGAITFSLFYHFTHDHTQWDRVCCIHFLIISQFCPWSHSMGPSVVHSFPHYFTILPMITLNGTEWDAFISSLFHHFTHDHIKWDQMWCIHFFKHFTI